MKLPIDQELGPKMDFLRSTFTVEVNETPIIVLQAKWAAEAEGIGFGWALLHSPQLSTKGSYGTDIPAVVKVRIARPTDKAAYEAEGSNSEFYEGTKIVYLVELNSLS
jgi:hypothetical protein